MGDVEAEETLQQRAAQVCSHCKSIKKGCDKKLPSCSQCIKRRATCRYGDPSEHRRYGDEVANTGEGGFNSSWTISLQGAPSTISPCLRLTRILMNSLSAAIPSRMSDPNEWQEVPTPYSQMRAQACHIVKADGQYIYDITSRYFKGVHLWLPIVSEKCFNERVTNFQLIPTADFSILLLAMQLITQHPCSVSDEGPDLEALDLATKTLLTQIQAFIPSSLYIIQAGVMLATYEHSHGMIEASYITIGTIARMAFAAGLHNMRGSRERIGSNAWFQDEEALSTWWGLVICDRIIGCEPQINDRPLATRYIREDDHIPVELKSLDGGVACSAEPSFRCSVSATSYPGVGTFGRHAQAAYLLDRVLLSVSSQELDDLGRKEMLDLDRTLQALLSTIMEQVAGRWGVYCGATCMVITALYILHRKGSMRPAIGGNNQFPPISSITLNTMTRMVIDIAAAFNLQSSTFDIEILSPSVAHIVRSAQEHILKADDFQSEPWLTDFEELRKMLRYINQRWPLAGKELYLLNRAVDSNTRPLL